MEVFVFLITHLIMIACGAVIIKNVWPERIETGCQLKQALELEKTQPKNQLISYRSIRFSCFRGCLF